MAVPLIAAAVPSIAEGVMGLFGQKSANAANAEQAKQQMDFQERMSNTQYQRAVADMRAAGLNPALAYQQGGAGTPSGASATMQNVAAGFKGTAQGAAQTYAAIQQAKNTEANTNLTDAQTNQLHIESADRLLALQKSNDLQDLAYRSNMYDANFKRESFGSRLDILKQQLMESIANVRDAQASATLKESAIPGAQAQAAHDRTVFGKTRPYVNDARSLIDALTDLIPQKPSVRNFTTNNNISTLRKGPTP